ncbi:MAG: TIGR03936 family radical SAM-associated protein [Blautia sp.]|nr:TIGR03936 family radical SAM-associated protein [Blautia sp.]
MKLRIKFRKFGPVRFIGHLDVMRFFQKAIRRAGIDVTYTTGFSPHQVMSFAAPLGVGLTSHGEYMDIEVNSMESASRELTSGGLASRGFCQDIMERLNRASVPGLEVVSVKVLPEGAGNAMASVAAASYTVRFREGREPAADLAATLPGFLAKEHILITKETKKGSREVDLRPGIYRLEWSGDAFYMLVDASSGGNIKPAQVMEALLADCGEALQENALLITREEVYANAGTEETPRLTPLDEIGFVQ